MSYRQPSFAGGHSSDYNKLGASNFSKPAFTPARNFKEDSVGGSFGQLEHLLEKERMKYRQMKDKMENQLDFERKNRIQCQNKLIRLKDQINQRDNRISELEFRQNSILHKMQDTQIENQKMKAELTRMQDLYSNRIQQLEYDLGQKTREYDEFNEQSNQIFQNFKKEGQQYIQSMKFEHDRMRKILEDKLRLAENTKKDLAVEHKRLTQLLHQNKIMYEEEIRQLSNRIRDQGDKKVNLQAKSFDQRVKSIEQARQSLHRKNLDLVRQLQDKDRFIQQLQRQKNNDIQRARLEISDLMAKNSQLSMLYQKIKGQLAQKSAIIAQSSGQSSQQVMYLKQQIQQKRKQIDNLNVSIHQLRQDNKDISVNYQRKRAQLSDRCNYFQNQAKKNKQLYNKLTQTLKAKITQTISNVGYR